MTWQSPYFPKLAFDVPDFKEGEHPRDNGGKFTSGGGVTGKQSQSVNRYVGERFRKINRMLRNGEKLSGRDKEDVQVLDSLISKSKLKQATPVYRGVMNKFSSDVGATINSKSFLSTTTDKARSEEFFLDPFGPRAGTMIKISLPKGFSALDTYSSLDTHHKKTKVNEKELLLPRNVQFRVKAKSKGKKRIHTGKHLEYDILELEPIVKGKK